MKISFNILLSAIIPCFLVMWTGASAETVLITPSAGVIFAHNLTIGSRGDDVSALQLYLISGGFLKIAAPTGYFGVLTKTALGTWQASLGIYPSVGFFGPISREVINTAIHKSLINTTSAQDIVSTTTTKIDIPSTTSATTSSIVSNSPDGSVASPVGNPIRLKIPKLNIDAGFQYNGLKPDGTMEIPDNIVDVGWYTGSPRPGEQGSAVVTGHVAQIRGGVMTKPGVFSNLSELIAGDKLNVINDKGESTTFVVRESRSYDPAADALDVFSSSDGNAHLNLITCEGIWNPGQLSYSKRLVVFTDAVK